MTDKETSTKEDDISVESQVTLACLAKRMENELHTRNEFIAFLKGLIEGLTGGTGESTDATIVVLSPRIDRVEALIGEINEKLAKSLGDGCGTTTSNEKETKDPVDSAEKRLRELIAKFEQLGEKLPKDETIITSENTPDDGKLSTKLANILKRILEELRKKSEHIDFLTEIAETTEEIQAVTITALSARIDRIESLSNGINKRVDRLLSEGKKTKDLIDPANQPTEKLREESPENDTPAVKEVETIIIPPEDVAETKSALNEPLPLNIVEKTKTVQKASESPVRRILGKIFKRIARI